MSLLPEEMSARETVRLLAAQLLELDFNDPESYEQCIVIATEIEHSAVIAVSARRNAETRVPLMLRPTIDESAWVEMLRLRAS